MRTNIVVAIVNAAAMMTEILAGLSAIRCHIVHYLNSSGIVSIMRLALDGSKRILLAEFRV